MAQNPNIDARRGVPTNINRVANEFPPMPTFQASCPDLYKRFPELARFDEALKRWRESIKQGGSTG